VVCPIRFRAVCVVMASALFAGATAVAHSAEPVCAVTLANGLGLTHRVGQGLAGNHGNASRTLATSLWPDGTVTFKPGGPGCLENDGAMWMKWPWWHEGKRKRLTIDGRRLDGAAPPLRARIRTGYSGEFQSSALIFPTPGCWEVTGRVEDQSVTFVVRAVKIGEGPPRCNHAR